MRFVACAGQQRSHTPQDQGQAPPPWGAMHTSDAEEVQAHGDPKQPQGVYDGASRWLDEEHGPREESERQVGLDGEPAFGGLGRGKGNRLERPAAGQKTARGEDRQPAPQPRTMDVSRRSHPCGVLDAHLTNHLAAFR